MALKKRDSVHNSSLSLWEDVHNSRRTLDFFHISEHVDHFNAIQVFSLRKKPEITGKVWSGDTPPPLFGKTPNFFRFFLVKASLNQGVGNWLLKPGIGMVVLVFGQMVEMEKLGIFLY